MREGEGHDLAGIGGVCHDLLIARHGGVETQFSNRSSCGTKAVAVENGSVRKHKASSRFLVR